MILRAFTTTCFFFLLLLFANTILAQNYPRKKFSWEEKRKITYKLTAEEQKLSAVIVLQHYYVDYIMGYTRSEGAELYVTEHKIVRVNSDAGINDFNKAYIQLFDEDELLILNARTIMPDGTIHYLADDQIKNKNNYEVYGDFKLFALEGVTKGCEVEYYYTVKKHNYSNGTIILENAAKTKEQSITLTYPDQLTIDTRCYNGFPAMKQEPGEDVKVWYAEAQDVPAPNPKELYAARWANRMKFAYKLTHNNSWPDQVNMNWSYALNFLYRSIYDDWDHPKISQLPIAAELKLLSKDNQIKKLESYLKEKYHFKSDPGWGKKLSTANYVFQNNVGSELGLAKLYVAYLMDLKIPFDVIITSNRYHSKFDPKFPDYGNLREIMIYFPQYQKFVCPSFHEYRYGPPPYEFASNYAMSITAIDSGSISIMPSSDARLNKRMLSFDVNFNMDSMYNNISAKGKWIGYEAVNIREKYVTTSSEAKTTILKALISNSIRFNSMDNVDAEGLPIDDSTYHRPITLSTKIKTAT